MSYRLDTGEERVSELDHPYQEYKEEVGGQKI